jgi:hypothetical protein
LVEICVEPMFKAKRINMSAIFGAGMRQRVRQIDVPQHAAAVQPEKPGLFGTEMPDSKQSSEANLSDEQGNYGINALYGVCDRINEFGIWLSKLGKEFPFGIDSVDEYNRTALHHAAISGDEQEIVTLCKNGANINAQDHNGATPLHHASDAGQVAAVKRLLQAGADINAQDNEGITALHYSASGKHFISVPNNWNKVPGRAGVARELLCAGADMNAQNKDGYTALHYSAAREQFETTLLLIERGADLTAPTRLGITAFNFLDSHFLLDPKKRQKIREALQQRKEAMANLLLQLCNEQPVELITMPLPILLIITDYSEVLPPKREEKAEKKVDTP